MTKQMVMEGVHLNPEGTEPMCVIHRRQNRHIVPALKHLNKRREALLEKRSSLTREIEEIDKAILALE